MSKNIMATIEFNYGVMGSGKSTRLLQMYHDLKKNNKIVLLAKPSLDTKGDKNIVSRIGLEAKCDFLISKDFDMFKYFLNDCNYDLMPDYILIDEVQFLTKKTIKTLVLISKVLNINVKGYGIKVDSNGDIFEGSSYMFALSDIARDIGDETISDLGSGEKAVAHIKYIDGVAVFGDTQTTIDGTDKVSYKSVSLKEWCMAYRSSIRR